MATYARSLIFIMPLLLLLGPPPGWRLDHTARSASGEARRPPPPYRASRRIDPLIPRIESVIDFTKATTA
jgi:hypothetical protein